MSGVYVPTDEELMDLFFELGLKGYVLGELQKLTISALPGSNLFRLERGPLLGVDCYWVNGGDSFGFTCLWVNGLPVWRMQYSGFCRDKAIIPFLKRALRWNYERKIFMGGRGPKIFNNLSDGTADLTYHNVTAPKRNFSGFHGFDHILEENGEVKYRHDYSGGLMIPRS